MNSGYRQLCGNGLVAMGRIDDRLNVLKKWVGRSQEGRRVEERKGGNGGLVDEGEKLLPVKRH